MTSERKRPDLSVLRMDPEELEERPRFGRLGWILGLLLLAAAAVVVWLYVPLPFLLPAVETATVRQVTPRQESTVLTATGYTYARQRAAVGSKIIGRVLELPVEEGDRVTTGDLIAVLDSADLEAAVAETEATLLERRAERLDAERAVRRQQRLVESGVSAQANLDDATTRLAAAEALVEAAQARIESARAQLEYTRIVSPIGGVIIEKNVEVGEMVAPGGFTSQQSTGAIVRIADPASLEVEADINESYIARLDRGQPAAIEVDAVPGHVYQGRLRQIVPTADRQRAVVEVKVAIDDRDERLVPDMSCTVTFLEAEAAEREVDAAPTLYVPTAAVLSGAASEASGGDAVFVLEGDIVRRRAVTLGEVAGQERVVLDGLSVGETVVLPGDLELEDGAQVRRRD
ncbi:MAG: efflux RND transporter periplasmic adaptor subunit [Acidobacteriota bacterium]